MVSIQYFNFSFHMFTAGVIWSIIYLSVQSPFYVIEFQARSQGRWQRYYSVSKWPLTDYKYDSRLLVSSLACQELGKCHSILTSTKLKKSKLSSVLKIYQRSEVTGETTLPMLERHTDRYRESQLRGVEISGQKSPQEPVPG